MANLSISKAWDECSAFLKREMRLVGPVALALFMVPSALAQWISPSGEIAGTATGLLVTLAVLVVAMTGQMTIAALAIGWSGSLGAALSRAATRVWGLLAASLIVFLPLSILSVVLASAVVGATLLSDPTKLTPEALAATPGFGMLLIVLIVLFLFVAVRLFPITAVAVSETSNPLRLLARSWQLTKGNFWRLLGVLSLLLIAAAVASLAVRSTLGTAMVIAAGEPRPFNLTALVNALAEGAVSAAITAVGAALVGRIYVQLSAGEASVPDVAREA